MMRTHKTVYFGAMLSIVLSAPLISGTEIVQTGFSDTHTETDKRVENGFFPLDKPGNPDAQEKPLRRDASFLEKAFWEIEQYLRNAATDGEEHISKEDISMEDMSTDGEEDMSTDSGDLDVQFVNSEQASPSVKYYDYKGPIKKETVAPVSLKEQTLGCADVLMGNQVFSDPTVGLAFTYVYTLCLMELAIQKYLQSEPYLQKDAKGLMGSGKKTLRQLQEILPSYLLGLKALQEGFRDGHLRHVLDKARENYQQKQEGIGL